MDFNEYFTLFTLASQSITMIPNYYPRLMELSGHVLLNHQYESKKGNYQIIFRLSFKIYLMINNKINQRHQRADCSIFKIFKSKF